MKNRHKYVEEKKDSKKERSEMKRDYRNKSRKTSTELPGMSVEPSQKKKALYSV